MGQEICEFFFDLIYRNVNVLFQSEMGGPSTLTVDTIERAGFMGYKIHTKGLAKSPGRNRSKEISIVDGLFIRHLF